jgi:hypothetical protein
VRGPVLHAHGFVRWADCCTISVTFHPSGIQALAAEQLHEVAA